MNLIDVVNNALNDYHKANTILNDIKNSIKAKAKKDILDKYQKNILKKDTHDYELRGVNSYCSFSENIFDENFIFITLYYVRLTQLSPNEKRRISQEIDRYKRYGNMWETNHKIPLIIELNYKLTIDKVIENSYNLELSL